MKTGLFIYSAIILLCGLVLFQATGSLAMLLLPVVGALIYSVVAPRGGLVPELVRFFFAALAIVGGLFQFEGNISAMVLIVLTLPMFVAATQCIWEMLHAGTVRETAPANVRASVFSAGFYAALGAAFLFLQSNQLKLSLAHKQLLAGVVLVLSLVAWDCCRVVRLKLGATKDGLNLSGKLARAGICVAASVLFMLVSLWVLPPLADALTKISPQWKLPGIADPGGLPDNKPKPREKDAAANKKPSGKPSDLPGIEGPEAATREGMAEVPASGEFKPTDEPRLVIKFANPADGLRLQNESRLYVRTLAFCQFDGAKWLPDVKPGEWREDGFDGKLDGKVDLVAKPDPAAIAHSVFVLDADGTHLPHLAGMQQAALPKIYVLPDEWYQVEPYGPIRYDAVSTPKLYQLLDADTLVAADPGLLYTQLPQGPLDSQLTRLGREVFGSRKKPAELVAALAGFFHSNYKYSDRIENPNRLSAMENFLFDERKGLCEHYATAAALLLRKADLATRMVYGYHQGEHDAKGAAHFFRANHAHAWTEVYFEGHGWVICDFTPPHSTAVQPANPAVAGTSGGGMEVNLGSFENIADIEKREAAIELKQPDLSLLEKLQAFAMENGQRIGGIFALLGIAGMVAYIVAKRRQLMHSPEEKARREAEKLLKQPAYFEEFVKMCAEFGHPHTSDLTLNEFQRQLKEKKFHHPDFDAMRHYHYATRYEDAPTSGDQETRWIESIRRFRQEYRILQKQASPLPKP